MFSRLLLLGKAVLVFLLWERLLSFITLCDCLIWVLSFQFHRPCWPFMYFLFLFRNRNCISYITGLYLPHSHFIKNLAFPLLSLPLLGLTALKGTSRVYDFHDLNKQNLNVLVTGWAPWEADSEIGCLLGSALWRVGRKQGAEGKVELWGRPSGNLGGLHGWLRS